MEQNKTGKYLKYAIGEIVLVVIGILIALQLNNWNERRLQNLKKIELTKQLLSEFEQNKIFLNWKLRYTKDLVNRLDMFLEISNKPELETPIDSIKKYASAGFLSNDLKLQLDTYNQAINTGDLGLLKNQELLSNFSRLQRQLNFYSEHMKISGNEFYQGSIYELRKEIGNLYNLDEIGTGFGPRKSHDAHKMNYKELLEFIGKKEVFAVFQNQLTIQYNFKESIEKMNIVNDKIIQQLKLELND